MVLASMTVRDAPGNRATGSAQRGLVRQLVGEALHERVQLRVLVGLPVLDEVAQAGGAGDDEAVADRGAAGRDALAVDVPAGLQLVQRGVEALRAHLRQRAQLAEVA